MIKGIGIDIVELKRVEQVLERKPRFLNRILSEDELMLYHRFPTEKRKLEFLAGRFAAKEAFSKAEGTGIGMHHSFRSIEILRSNAGQPQVFYQGKHREFTHVSISHSKGYVVAQVIVENGT